MSETGITDKRNTNSIIAFSFGKHAFSFLLKKSPLI